VKAFNTIFGEVLAQGKPLDAFLAGDSVEAKTRVADCLQSLGMRPLDVRWVKPGLMGAPQVVSA